MEGMNIIMEKIFSAKTLEEAKNMAYEFFKSEGIEQTDIDFEIIEQPIKKLFGTKGEYKVKAVAEEKSAAKSISSEAKEIKEFKEAKTKSTPSANDGEKYTHAIKYLTGILNALGAKDYEIKIIEKTDMTVLDIVGENLGIAIGRRGETLDSLQYLTILANNRLGEQYSRISVDCNGYREKRHDTLEALAKRTATKVLKQGRRITLEPMNPYERRIIHSTVSEIEGVYSNSIGEEPYRKVVISANVPKYRNNNSDNKDNRDSRDNRDRNGNRDRRSGGAPNAGRSYKQSNNFSTSFEREYKRTPSENVEISQDTVEVEKSTSLYGKIEL